MKETERRPHLWIPEGEILEVRKNPVGRGRDYNLEHASHGEFLSRGLESVSDYIRRSGREDSLRDEDLIPFEIVLQEKEEISSLRKFLETQGLRLNAVIDSTHAVVSSSFGGFRKLEGRVGEYRGKGRRKNFQLIREFNPFRGDRKTTLRAEDGTPSFDIEFELLPGLPEEMLNRVMSRIGKRIENGGGTVCGEPFYLSRTVPVIRAVVPKELFSEIREDMGIYRIEPTSVFSPAEPSMIIPFDRKLEISPDVDIDSLPAVVVLDDGVNLPPELESVVPVHWTVEGCRRTPDWGRHGTPVASKVIFGDLGIHLSEGRLVPRARVIDAQIKDDDEVFGDVMAKRIREAVEVFSSVSKIFNLSYNAGHALDGNRMSYLGTVLDDLAREFNVRFVVSMGNHNLFLFSESLDEVIGSSESRLSEPADSMLSVSVGSVSRYSYSDSISREKEIAPYSRRGPGAFGSFKPDLVAYGANQLSSGTVPADAYSLCLTHVEFNILSGTSFTAPSVAGDLAQIISIMPDCDILLAQALLYNGALPFGREPRMTRQQVEKIGNLYGRGLSIPENSMYSSPDRVCFLNTGTMNRLTKKRVRFLIPSVSEGKEPEEGKRRIRITVTCVALPPTDARNGIEYVGAYISASIHRLNANGKSTVSNPHSGENRIKWNVCCHFSNEFSSFSPGDWEVWLELFTRSGVENDEEIPYALVISVEDLTRKENIYETTVRESAGRFMPQVPTHVKVR